MVASRRLRRKAPGHATASGRERRRREDLDPADAHLDAGALGLSRRRRRRETNRGPSRGDRGRERRDRGRRREHHRLGRCSHEPRSRRERRPRVGFSPGSFALTRRRYVGSRSAGFLRPRRFGRSRRRRRYARWHHGRGNVARACDDLTGRSAIGQRAIAWAARRRFRRRRGHRRRLSDASGGAGRFAHVWWRRTSRFRSTGLLGVRRQRVPPARILRSLGP